MLHPSKARLTGPAACAAAARRDLARLKRPAGTFDAQRYFRDAGTLRFYNVGAARVRHLAREIADRQRSVWSVRDAATFADLLMREPVLEVKALGIEVLACYRREFRPGLLPAWKRWLARGDSANWATTDALCGLLIGPLLLTHPRLMKTVSQWAGHRGMWVRRASAVSLIPAVRNGRGLTHAYGVARRLRRDDADLIQKAVGWMLREAGKTDSRRLERYLLTYGPTTPRTTVRYAIERFPPERRRALLEATRGAARPG